jgi:predicted metalloprotease with PDZ domain
MTVPRRAAPPLVACLLLAGGAWAQEPAVVSHRVSFPELNRQYAHIVSEFPAPGSETTLVMANWTPGSYVIEDFAANLDRIEAHDAAGNPLRLKKVRKNTWRAEMPGAGDLVVDYDVFMGDLGVSTSWASPDFVLLNGASVFLYTESTRTLVQEVTVDVPAGRGRVLTPLPRADRPGRWRAGNFDELVDNPLVIAAATPASFREGGHRYHLVHVGGSALWDEDRAAADVRRIVAATNRFWGEVPLQRDFWFFNFLVEGSGGLEHDHGTVLMTSRWQMRKRDDYVKWLSLVAHEYFHAWNVRRMRPAALAAYDYEREQYSDTLWLAEGLTSYYDNLLLSRAGLVTPDEYFRRLAIDFHRLELTPGRHLLSLEDASRDAWIRHYHPDANAINSQVSYYNKGAVVGFALDARLRRDSRERSSLDDVMQRMWREWGGRAYPDHAFAEMVESVGGKEVRDWLEPLLETTAGPDIDAALAWYGLELDRHPERTAAEAAGEPLAAGIGVNWDKDRPGLVVGSVINGLPAAAAGILPGDELLAIDDERITLDSLDDRLRRLRPGDTVSLLLARRGRIRTVDLVLARARPVTYELGLSPGFGARQLRRLESWLGQELRVDKP